MLQSQAPPHTLVTMDISSPRSEAFAELFASRLHALCSRCLSVPLGLCLCLFLCHYLCLCVSVTISVSVRVCARARACACVSLWLCFIPAVRSASSCRLVGPIPVMPGARARAVPDKRMRSTGRSCQRCVSCQRSACHCLLACRPSHPRGPGFAADADTSKRAWRLYLCTNLSSGLVVSRRCSPRRLE